MRPLEPSLPGETRSEYLARVDGKPVAPARSAVAVTDQQLVARIKRSSKYWSQTAPNAWFNVRVVTDDYYQLRGNHNNYRFSDVVMGMRIGDVVMDFKTGRSSGAPDRAKQLSDCQRPEGER